MAVARFRVRLTPKGGRDAIEGWADHLNERVLKARVAAPPEDGKANAALLALLAKTLGLAKSHLRIAGGETSRVKTIELNEPGRSAADVAARLATLGDSP